MLKKEENWERMKPRQERGNKKGKEITILKIKKRTEKTGNRQRTRTRKRRKR